MKVWIWFACLLMVSTLRPAGAHEVRPGYLELRATATIVRRLQPGVGSGTCDRRPLIVMPQGSAA